MFEQAENTIPFSFISCKQNITVVKITVQQISTVEIHMPYERQQLFIVGTLARYIPLTDKLEHQQQNKAWHSYLDPKSKILADI